MQDGRVPSLGAALLHSGCTSYCPAKEQSREPAQQELQPLLHHGNLLPTPWPEARAGPGGDK